jgi:hypothetical protein
MSGALRDAIVRTVLYADVFDHPMRPWEVHRYLVGQAATRAEVEELLSVDLPRPLERTGPYVHLHGRGGTVAVRERRRLASASLWPTARRYARIVARLPLVRGVAISGALAMDNTEADSDIDLFVLAQPGRVWTCRLLLVALVLMAQRRGARLCPNYVLSADRLEIARHDLFTAHEIVQMVAVERSDALEAFVRANAWTSRILPNAVPSIPVARIASPPLARAASYALASPLFAPVERWERERKIRKLQARERREGGSVTFTAYECRGHFGAHDVRVLAAFAARAARIEASVS